MSITSKKIDFKLSCIITGMERSGTTFLSQNIASHSLIKAGFECGISLGSLSNFEKIKPFSQWLSHGQLQFGLPNNYLDEIKKMNYYEVYNYIGNKKGSKLGNDQSIINKSKYFYDKTPLYIYNLDNIIKKLNNNNINVPIFVILKFFDEIYFSKVIKRGQNKNAFLSQINKVIKQLRNINNNNYNNLFIINYNAYINNLKKYNIFIMKKINEINKNITIEELDHSKYTKLFKNHVYQNYKIIKNKKIEIPNDLLKIKKSYDKILKNNMLKL